MIILKFGFAKRGKFMAIFVKFGTIRQTRTL